MIRVTERLGRKRIGNVICDLTDLSLDLEERCQPQALAHIQFKGDYIPFLLTSKGLLSMAIMVKMKVKDSGRRKVKLV